MRQFQLIFGFTGLLAFIAACSDSSGKKGNGDGSNQVIIAQSKEEALTKLAPEQSQSFETWKSQLVKACDASQAFGIDKESKLETSGVDGAVLLQKNAYSMIFADAGSFALLTSYNTLSGTGTSKVEHTETFNGRGYSLAAETKRVGSTCEVYLFGQKVFETYLVKNFIIGSHWAPAKEARVNSNLPQIKTLGSSGLAELSQDGIFNLVSQSLQPTADAISLIAHKLELKDEQAKQLFILSNASSPASSLRIKEESSAIWNNQSTGNVLAPASLLNQAFNGSEQTLPLEIRLNIPEFSFIDSKNTSDQGNYKLNLLLRLTKQDARFNYQTQSVELAGLMAYDQEEALQCSRTRALAYESNAQSTNIQPSVQAMLSPCLTLFHDLEKSSRYSDLMKSLLPQKFAGIVASAQFQYGGWDEVLGRLAIDSLNQGKDLRKELDPNAQTKIIGMIADYLSLLQAAIDNTQNMQQAKDAVFQMGLNWSFKNLLVTPSRVQQILQALDNTIDVFKVSSERLLASLALQPNSQDDLLSFAQTIDKNYKTEILHAASLAKDLNYTDFELNIFQQLLQKKLSLADCQTWTLTLDGISQSISEFTNFGPLKNDIVGLSVKWLKSGEAQLPDLKLTYQAISNVVEPFSASTSELMHSVALSLRESKATLDFARTLTPEYKQLVSVLADQAKTAEFSSWGESLQSSILQKQPSMQQLKDWNVMWTAAQAFIQRETLKTQGALASGAERNRKDIIELAIGETWSNLEFSSLESISEFAKYKNTCERYQDASSLANCAGLKLFSKQKAKLFDPLLAGRYVQLAQDFVTYVKQLGPNATLLRWTLVDAFLDSSAALWSQCSQDAFNQKARSLKAEVNAIVSESDQFKKWSIERQIKDSLENCQ